jgi:phage shock protein PspC (stress-responsive transcriptional regulator)
MKKTLTINLNGQVFNIDEDAYDLLDVYLKNLQNYFRKEEGQDEIISDFESRIEEIFNQKIRKGASNVISIADVENVIKLVGTPSDFDEQNNAENAYNHSFDSQQKSAYNPERRNKKLYRNPNNKMLGGVCSGLATFFGIDTTIVRIILFILVVFWGTGILFYVLLWLLVPEAKTAEQQLEMTGEAINLENIGKVLSDNAKSMGNDVKTAYNKIDNSGFGSIFIKLCFIALGIFVGLIILWIIIRVLFAVLFGISTTFWDEFISYTPDIISLFKYPTVAAVGCCMFIIIPLISILYVIISRILKWKPLNKWVKVAGVVLWISSFVMLGFAGIKLNESKNINIGNWHIKSSLSYDIVGDGNIIEQHKNFSGIIDVVEIYNDISIDLQIDNSITDNTSDLTIEGDSNILTQYIDIFQQGNKLIFKVKKYNYNIHQSKNYLAKLQINNLKKVYLAGVSHINLCNELKTSEFEIEMNGASNFNAFDIQADIITVEMSGASRAELKGKADKAKMDLSGATNLSSFCFAVKNAVVSINGASKLECNVEEHLDGEVSGASKVIYKGTPMLTVECRGASNVKKK